MMKVKFIAKLTSILAVVLIILISLNSFYIKTYYYTDTYGEVEKFVSGVPDNIAYANFGSSHGLSAFSYDGDSGFNFSLSGQDLEHDFLILQQYSERLKEGATVAFAVSYFSFFSTYGAPSQKRYYFVLDKNHINNYSFETYINTKLLPVVRSGEFLIKNFINEEAVGSVFDESDTGGNTDTPQTQQETVNTHTLTDGTIIEMPIKDGFIQTEHDMTVNSQSRAKEWKATIASGGNNESANVELLIKMIQFCYDNKLKPVLVTTPVFGALNDCFTPEELNNCFYGNLNRVIQATGVPYLDLSDDKDFESYYFLFGNCDHLNGNGSKVFMHKYNSFLNEIGYTDS